MRVQVFLSYHKDSPVTLPSLTCTVWTCALSHKLLPHVGKHFGLRPAMYQRADTPVWFTVVNQKSVQTALLGLKCPSTGCDSSHFNASQPCSGLLEMELTFPLVLSRTTLSQVLRMI